LTKKRWLPFLLFGFISLILAAIIFSFPKKLTHTSKKSKQLRKAVGESISLEPPSESLEKEPLNDQLAVLNITEPNGMIASEDQPVYKDPVVKSNGFHHNNKHNKKLFLETLENTGSLLSLNKLGVSSNHINDKDEDQDDDGQEMVQPEVKLPNGEEAHSSPKSKKELIDSTITLLKKPIYLFVIVASAIEGLLQNSFLAFAALFLEYQYRLASGTASLVLGLLSIPPLMIGGILSGVIVKKLHNKTSHCFKILSVVLFINIIVYSGFMIYCKEPNMISEQVVVGQSNYSTTQNCNCNKRIFKPVCLSKSDDVFFQSACLAGCSVFEKSSDTYSNCTQEMGTYRKFRFDSDHVILKIYFLRLTLVQKIKKMFHFS
jgi:hypothetical protein